MKQYNTVSPYIIFSIIKVTLPNLVTNASNNHWKNTMKIIILSLLKLICKLAEMGWIAKCHYCVVSTIVPEITRMTRQQRVLAAVMRHVAEVREDPVYLEGSHSTGYIADIILRQHIYASLSYAVNTWLITVIYYLKRSCYLSCQSDDVESLLLKHDENCHHKTWYWRVTFTPLIDTLSRELIA